MTHMASAAALAAATASRAPVRGVIGIPRADASGDPKALITALNKAFEEFKDANDTRYDELKKGVEDAVSAEKVETINAAITDISAQLDKVVKDQARARLSGSGNENDRDWKQEARLFLAAKDGKPVLSVSDDQVDQYKAYASAHSALLRRGGKHGETLQPDVQNALSVGQDSDGGFLVPTQVSQDIIKRIYETSDVRSLAASMTISTDKIVLPLDLEEAASGGWVSESGTRSETATPGVGEQTVETWEQYAEPKATQRILDDAAVDVEGWLAGKIAEILERTENGAFVTGDGINKPKGFLGYAASAVTTADATRAWGKLQYVATGTSAGFAPVSTGVLPGDKLLDLVYSLKAAYRANARFVMNRASASTVRQLKDADGNYLWQPSLVAGQPSALLGYPIAEFEDMPDIEADTFAVAFGDFRTGYLIVDRLGIRVLRDPYTTKGFVKFYTTKRVGGDVTNFDAIKLLKFGTS